jgi:transposase
VVAPLIFQGSCNTEIFMLWIEQQLVPSLKRGQVVVMDNASFHKSPKIRELIELAECRLIYLPPYSPDLNPIEIFWANMKHWIKQNIPNIHNTWNALIQFFNAKYST